jgi:hypothetical protein
MACSTLSLATAPSPSELLLSSSYTACAPSNSYKRQEDECKREKKKFERGRRNSFLSLEREWCTDTRSSGSSHWSHHSSTLHLNSPPKKILTILGRRLDRTTSLWAPTYHQKDDFSYTQPQFLSLDYDTHKYHTPNFFWADGITKVPRYFLENLSENI